MLQSHPVTARPAGRRERKKARTRQEIYAAAMSLSLARGFDAVTVEDICRAADVARGTFFLHFPTKDALLAEYGRQATQEMAGLLRAHRGGAASQLHKILAFLAERAVRHPEIVRLTVREVMTRPAVLADATEQARDFVQLVAAVVHRGQARDEFRRGVDATVAAAVVVSAYFAIVNQWATGAEKLDLGAALEQMLDVVLNGLRRKS